MSNLSSIFPPSHFKHWSALAATTTIAWKFDIPLLSIRSLALTIFGQAVVLGYFNKFISDCLHSIVSETENENDPAQDANLITLMSLHSTFCSHSFKIIGTTCIPCDINREILSSNQASTNNSAEEAARIRHWMQNQQSNIDAVTFIEGGDERLLGIPREIRLFRNLEKLSLGIKINSLKGVIFPNSLRELYLENNKISSLRGVVFPDSLQKLDLRHNQINNIDGVSFPNSLQELDLRYNLIYSLRRATFPDYLRELDLGHNQIRDLDGVIFCDYLDYLCLRSNRISSMAGVRFPVYLRSLHMEGNQISSLDGVTFPSSASLQNLYLRLNRITSLAGARFSPCLQILNLEQNGITSLVGARFPSSLQILDLRYNHINNLDNISFPSSLRPRLDGNPISRGLPLNSSSVAHPFLYNYSSTTLSSSSRSTANSTRASHVFSSTSSSIAPSARTGRPSIYNYSSTTLSSSSHSTANSTRASHVFSSTSSSIAPSTRTVRTYFYNYSSTTLSSSSSSTVNSPQTSQVFSSISSSTASSANNVQTTYSLTGQLNAWDQEIATYSSAFQINRFTSLERILSVDERTNLANYLRRLREIKDYRDGSTETRRNVCLRVARLLDLAAKNAEFRGKMNAAISQGLESCGDRVLIIFNDLEILWQMYQEMTDARAVKLATQAQRYEELKKYASKKVRELDLRDEIEAILNFHLNLRTKLDLPITTEGMLYPNYSGVNQTMLNEAEIAIRKIPHEELLGNSDFWQSRMRKKYPAAVRVLEQEYAELLDNAEEYDQKNISARRQFCASHKKFAALLQELDEPFVYNKVAEAISKARGIAISDVWKYATQEMQLTSLSSVSSSSISSMFAQ